MVGMKSIKKRFIALALIFAIIISVSPIEILAKEAEEVMANDSQEIVEDTNSSGDDTNLGESEKNVTIDEKVETEKQDFVSVQSETVDFIYTILNGTYCSVTGYSGTEMEVTIPSEIEGYVVQNIGNGAFKGNTTLRKVIFPDTVETIGSNVFDGCIALTEVVFNNGLTDIGSAAFNNCTTLQGITLPDSIKRINDRAFAGCTELKEVNLPEGLTEIYAYAFENCAGLVNIDIPDSVTTMSARAFYSCQNLESVGYPLEWTIVSDYYYNSSNYYSDGDSHYQSPFEGCTSLKKIEIPEGVIQIPKYAFRGQTSIEEVVLPESATEIGAYAFDGSKSLKKIHLQEGLTTIYAYAFQNCTGLENIDIPDSVTTMSARAFYNCGKLSAVGYPSGWTTVLYSSGYGSPFMGCTALKKIEIPEGVTEIPKHAFREQTSIEEVILPESVTSIGEYAFFGSRSLKKIQLPEGMTVIEECTFTNCSMLAEIVFPKNLTMIGKSAFSGCSRLGEVNLPEELTTIYAQAFVDCIGLESIDIPESVLSMGASAFSGCKKMQSVTIHGKMQRLDVDTFSECRELKEINLPEGLTTIYANAFGNCTGLESIDIPDSVTTMSARAFYNCKNLSSVGYPSGWTTVLNYYNSSSYQDGSDTYESPFVGCTSLKKIEIPEGVTEIPKHAFRKQISIEKVILPDSVTSIGVYAFDGCKSLKKIPLSEGMTTIESHTFSNCIMLTEITLPDSVTTIGDSAFRDCIGLSNINLSEKLTTIYAYAFQNCIGLENIDLPDSVTTMSARAFYNCGNLSTVGYPSGWTTVLDYYNKNNSDDSSGSYESPFTGCTSLKKIEIPEGGTEIPKHAFQKQTAMKEVILPKDLTGVGAYAFEGCSKLERIWINQEVTTIGNNAFYNCKGLTIHGIEGSYAQEYAAANNIPFSSEALIYPSTIIRGRVRDEDGNGLEGIVVTLYDRTQNMMQEQLITDQDGMWSSNEAIIGHTYQVRFYHTDYEIKENAYTYVIGEEEITAFTVTATVKEFIPETPAEEFTYKILNEKYCEITGYKGNASEIRLPSEIDGYVVQRVGNGAFQSNKTLVRVAFPETVESMGDNVFEGCTMLADVAFNYGLTNIGTRTFYNCTSLAKIVLPDSMDVIGGYAFADCTNLSDVDLPEGLMIIYAYAFQNCIGLERVDIPDSVTIMSAYAFENCKKLSTVEYPSGWTTVLSKIDGNSIYDSAYGSPFVGCTSLKKIEIPEGVTEIPKYAFKNQASIEEVVLPESVMSIGAYAFDGSENLKKIHLPEKMTAIEDHTFRECVKLTKIDVPKSVTVIGDSAFSGCTGLSEINLPEGLTAIYAYAFQNCTSLERIDIPDSVTTMSARAFYNCVKLSTVGYPSGWTTVLAYNNRDDYSDNDNYYYSPFEGCTSLKKIEIPEGVTEIPKHAFRNQTSIEEVVLPKSVTRIGVYAFFGSKNLKKIHLPGGITAIEAHTFHNCIMLTEIEIPKRVTVIDAYAFSGCAGLGEVNLPEGLTTIYSYAFQGCTGLEQIDIPDSVTTMSARAFQNCVKLSSVRYPLGWTTVLTDNNRGDYSDGSSYYYSPFEGCTSLKKIEIPEGVTEVPKHAFRSQTAIEEVILPESLTGVGAYAFYGCSKLEKIWIDQGVTMIGRNTFNSCKVLTIHGVEGSYAQEYAAVNQIPFSSGTMKYPSTTIRGKVEDEDGNGLEGIVVTLYDLTRNKMQEKLRTDQAGRWSNSEAIIGHTYQVRFHHVDYELKENAYTYVVGEEEIIASTVTAIAKEVIPETPAEEFTYKILNGRACEITGYKGKRPAIRLPSEIDGYLVQRVGDSAFKGNVTLVKVVFPETVESIGQSVFDGCTMLADVALNYGLTNIGSYAFRGCTFLKKIVVPDSVAAIGRYAFANCTNLSEVNLSEGLTAIYAYAFQACTGLEYVDIPDSVTTMSAHAFYNCEKLSTVGYPSGWITVLNASDGSGNGASPFVGCVSLKRIEVPEGVTKIPEYAFRSQTAIEEIILPESLTSIGQNAFGGCVKLKSIHLVEGLTEIANYAFQKCVGINVLTLPSTVKSVGDHAFYGCSGLRIIYMNENLKTIGSYAFSGCTGLVSLVLNDGLERISSAAFKDCLNLTAVEIPASVTVMANDSFSGCNKLTIYCYSGTVAHRVSEAQGYRFILLDEHEHQYVLTVEVLPTCTEGGSQIHTCSICGYNYIEILEPLGHAWSEWIVEMEASVLTEGRKTRTCANCSQIEEVITEKVVVDYTQNMDYGMAHFTVVDATTKEAIPNANVFVTTETEGEATFVTDAKGKLDQILPVGNVRLSVYGREYKTRNISITVLPGENEIPTIGISKEDLVKGELTTTEMTYDEMIEAGIDVDDPDNQHIYKYGLVLEFTPVSDIFYIDYYIGKNNLPHIYDFGMGGDGSSGSCDFILSESGDEGIKYVPSDGGESISIYPINEKFFLIIYGEVHWLKEMYDIELRAINTSQTDTVEDLTAELTLPEGLSLAKMADKEQSLVQNMGNLSKGESKSVHWYVRGDKEGTYSISASLRGKMMPFGDTFEYIYEAKDPIKVYDGSAMHLTYHVPDSAFYQDDYTVRIDLENVSDRTLYNVTHAITDVRQIRVTTYLDESVEVEEYPVTGGTGSITIKEFKPGEVIQIEVTTEIMFQSKMVQHYMEKAVKSVKGMKGLMDGFGAFTQGVELIELVSGWASGSLEAIDKFTLSEGIAGTKKAVLAEALAKEIRELASRCEGDPSSQAIKAIGQLEKTGTWKKIEKMTDNPNRLNDYSEKELDRLASEIKAAKQEITSSAFNPYDVITTAIELIPVRFALIDSWVATLEGSTTVIPSTIVVEPTGARYFGVDSVSKYVWNLMKACIGKELETPGLAKFLGMDFKEDIGYYDAVEYVKMVEEKAKEYNITATSGAGFTAWVERADGKARTGVAEPNFELSINNETAEYTEDGKLHFTGSGILSVTPKSKVNGVLCIEMEDGTVKRYTMEVVEPHECHSSQWIVASEPTDSENGLKVKYCDICDEIIDMQAMVSCRNHKYSEYEAVQEPELKSVGVKKSTCIHCGHTQYIYTDAFSLNGYVYCFEEGTKETDIVEFFQKNGIEAVMKDGIGGEYPVSTGAVLTSDGTDYQIVIRGDTNGDSEVNLFDLMEVNNYLNGEDILEGAALEASLSDIYAEEPSVFDLLSVVGQVNSDSAMAGGVR